MAEPFLAEIRICSFVFAPKGWALCNGQLLPINQNQGLFSLLGTTYGGDGRVNFGLPDLRGRVPLHAGPYLGPIGARGGEEGHTLSIAELPTHLHTVSASSGGAASKTPTGSVWAANGSANSYSNHLPDVAMDPATVQPRGGSQAHLNMAPFLVLNFCIALQGIFPSQT